MTDFISDWSNLANISILQKVSQKAVVSILKQFVKTKGEISEKVNYISFHCFSIDELLFIY